MKQGGIAVILAEKLKKKDSEDSEDYEEAKLSAAEDVMRALKDSDAPAFSEALQSFIEMCSQLP